ncbi:MAG: hypothetical protein JW757_00410 [Anaerolineales bacterium]|nr:hypothetical protein [Anaerolineales bacterium]
MVTEDRAKRSVVLFLVSGVVVFLFGVNCTLGALLSEQIHIDQTNTNFAQDTEWAQTYTEEARNYNEQTAAAQQVTANARSSQFAASVTAYAATSSFNSTQWWQTELAPKPPVITGINFPKEIPGNKSTIIGLLYFTDPDGDISHVVYNVVSATNFGGGTDANPKLDSGTWTNGAIKIYLWCEGQQVVTLEATIFDHKGNKSNTMSFTFTCK